MNDETKNESTDNIEILDSTEEVSNVEVEMSVEESLQAEVETLKKDQLYLRAEYDNYRKKATRERSDIIKYAGERLASDLLDTVDIFETALATDITAENYPQFCEGIQHTYKQLLGTLEKHGILSLNPVGEKFDPNFHEALSSEPTNEFEDGHISRVFKKPYKYHDKLLRPGQVIVATPIETETE